MRALLAMPADVTHVHVGVASPMGFWAALQCARAGRPTVVTVHSLWAWAHPIFWLLNLLAGYSRRPIRWTAVSEAAAGQVRRALGPRRPVTVLPNGIDPERWAVDYTNRPWTEP